MNQVEQDLRDYYKLMLEGNTYGCGLIEKKYELYGASPAYVTTELAELALAVAAQELIERARLAHIEIYLHLPDYEGRKLIMVSGAITTQERFAKFDISLCHLCENGIIMRKGRKIGTVANIEVLTTEL